MPLPFPLREVQGSPGRKLARWKKKKATGEIDGISSMTPISMASQAVVKKMDSENCLQNCCSTSVMLSALLHFNTACGERTRISLQLRAKVHYFSPRSEETCSPLLLPSVSQCVWLSSWVIGHGFN